MKCKTFLELDFLFQRIHIVLEGSLLIMATIGAWLLHLTGGKFDLVIDGNEGVIVWDGFSRSLLALKNLNQILADVKPLGHFPAQWLT